MTDPAKLFLDCDTGEPMRRQAAMFASDSTTGHTAIFAWRVSVRARHSARKLFEQCVFGPDDRGSLEYLHAVLRYREAAGVEASAYDTMSRVVFDLIDRGSFEWSELADEFGLTAAVVSNLRVRHALMIRGISASGAS